ncbi:hypothetical protein F4820DRAFT_420660 [Hypoxylon rubiginosum]|uniref:Uncharacterized protein n=1 Tax=Hypoxylon rubiginosum TaxID=110542 RepID=A0ACB9Z2N6_9PEZI|nr:hypothetical protein F4820DRAFT_420660 [Hypoxylon rubiginosum]
MNVATTRKVPLRLVVTSGWTLVFTDTGRAEVINVVVSRGLLLVSSYPAFKLWGALFRSPLVRFLLRSVSILLGLRFIEPWLPRR